MLSYATQVHGASFAGRLNILFEKQARERTDAESLLHHTSFMMSKSAPILIAVDRLNDGIIVRFNEGTCVLFSTALLYALSPQARATDETEEAW